jgi:hypothetical protein
MGRLKQISEAPTLAGLSGAQEETGSTFGDSTDYPSAAGLLDAASWICERSAAGWPGAIDWGKDRNMANALHERYAELLMDRIRADRYPSVNHMNLLEQIATPRVLAEYTLHLFERIEADIYPSPMMQRMHRPRGALGCLD